MSIKDCRYDGSRKLDLSKEPTGVDKSQKEKKAELLKRTAENIAEAAVLQEKLYAEGREGLVIAVQARDAAGKDSLIKHVFTGLNPAGLTVHSFKAPNSTELSHDYLWRINQCLPARGSISLFNRSQYEDVLVVKVHHMEQGYRMPKRCITEDFFERRYRQLVDWETYLYENGIRMVKIFLNVSADTQRDRFIDRIERDDKHWKLSSGDMKERALWAEYNAAYEDCINATGTEIAPWYVLPADNKWYTRYLMSEILVKTLRDMAPEFPPLDVGEAARIPEMLEELNRNRPAGGEQ